MYRRVGTHIYELAPIDGGVGSPAKHRCLLNVGLAI